MDQSPFARPISTASAAGGERFSQAPTVVVDAALDGTPASRASVAAAEDDLQPPTALANRNSAAFGDRSPSNLSANNLPYRNSLAPTAAGSAQHLGDSDKEAAAAAASDAPRGTSPFPDLGPQSNDEDASKNKRKRLFLILGGVAALAIVAVAVAVPVAITQTRKSSSSSSSTQPTSSGPDDTGSGETGGPTTSGPTVAVTGGDGSIITTEKGTTFTYVNKFGGVWYDDPNDPYNNNARAQSWSPPLSQEFDWQNDPMRG